MPRLTLDTPTGPFTLIERDGALVRAGWRPDAGEEETPLLAEAARQVSEVYGAPSTLASDLLKALPEARKLLEPPSPRGDIMSRFEGGQSPI